MEYTLKCGDLSAVATSQGGELFSFKTGDGKEYLWQGNPEFWAGRNPNLFPIVGSLINRTILVDGAPYHMDRHGFARISEYSVADQGDDFIVFELVESASTLQVYPFRFRLRIRHQILNNGFSSQFEIFNPGNVVLPFCVGAHAAFNCPANQGERFSDYRLVFDKPENSSLFYPDNNGYMSMTRQMDALNNTDTLPLNHETFAKLDTLVFEGLNSSGVSLLGPNQHGVHMDFSGFPIIAFWTNGAKQAPYICLEPWHGCAGFDDEDGIEFCNKRHCVLLPPGETKVLKYTVTLV